MKRLTEEQQKLLEKYVVVENEEYNGQNGKYFIYARNTFKHIPCCETYTNYGIKLEHEEVCGEGEEHQEVYAKNFHDGRNWKTVILNEDFCNKEVATQKALEILAEMPEFPYIEKATKEIKTQTYTFYFSRYPVPEICQVV